ncbi:MAG: methyltransferase domain-containing protein [Nitrososphaera sp.]
MSNFEEVSSQSYTYLQVASRKVKSDYQPDEREMLKACLSYIQDDPVEQRRYLTLKETLETFRSLILNRRVLDFGASYGLSAFALIELGARTVIGVEPNIERVKRGRNIIRDLGLEERAVLLQVPGRAQLPFATSSFEVVFANAVLEHIPAPRTPFLRELWRVLAPGGHLIINESPNKYLPVDFHTTGGLWFVPWMPSKWARRYAIWRGRFSKEGDWSSSGWRGVGYYEITKALGPHHKFIAETSRLRHRALGWLHLPASLFDPYPILIFEKLNPW